jgi:hypothetical protein
MIWTVELIETVIIVETEKLNVLNLRANNKGWERDQKRD